MNRIGIITSSYLIGIAALAGCGETLDTDIAQGTGSSSGLTGSSSGESAPGSSSGQGGSSSSGSTPPPPIGAPSLTSNVVLARAGAQLTLTGANLGAAQGDSLLDLGGAGAVTPLAWSNDSVRFRVPASLRGRSKITLTIGSTTLEHEVRIFGQTPRPTLAYGNGSPGMAAISSEGALVTWGCQSQAVSGSTRMCQHEIYDGDFFALGFGNFRLFGLQANTLSVFTGTDGTTAYAPSGQYKRVTAAPSFRLGLTTAGQAHVWSTDDAQPVATERLFADSGTLVDVAAGWYYAMALREDGRVNVTFRSQPDTANCGQNQVPAGLTNVVAIAAGVTHALALKDDGTVVSWGGEACGGNSQTAIAPVPDGLDQVVAISAGAAHSLALRADGTVAAWGVDDHQIVSGPNGKTGVHDIVAGYNLSATVDGNGVITTWSSPTSIYADLLVVPEGLRAKLAE